MRCNSSACWPSISRSANASPGTSSMVACGGWSMRSNSCARSGTQGHAPSPGTSYDLRDPFWQSFGAQDPRFASPPLLHCKSIGNRESSDGMETSHKSPRGTLAPILATNRKLVGSTKSRRRAKPHGTPQNGRNGVSSGTPFRIPLNQTGGDPRYVEQSLVPLLS